MHYPLKALCVQGNTWIEFSVMDAPKKYKDNTFYLAARPQTPLMRVSTIKRGFDLFIKGVRLFENDILYDSEHDKYYFVDYHCGMSIKSEAGVKVIFTDFEHLEVCDSENLGKFPQQLQDIAVQSKERQLLFSDGELYFNIFSIVAVSENRLLINTKGGLTILGETIRQYTGVIAFKKRKLYFGDVVNDIQICMHVGRIGYWEDDVFVEASAKGARRKLR